MWRDTYTISELEFIAENELIEINPNFKKDEYKLTCGTYGPFKPNKAVKVPLWLALQFKKKKRCKIIPPTWMDASFLSERLDAEKGTESLGDLPYHFYEVSQILFHKAEDDIEGLKQVKIILEDIQTVRFAKIYKYLDTVPAENLVLNLSHICARELEQIRPYVTGIFELKLETLSCKYINNN